MRSTSRIRPVANPADFNTWTSSLENDRPDMDVPIPQDDDWQTWTRQLAGSNPQLNIPLPDGHKDFGSWSAHFIGGMR